MKRNIIAIGGGKIMVPKHRQAQTLSIDQAIVEQVKRNRRKCYLFRQQVKTMPSIVMRFDINMKRG